MRVIIACLTMIILPLIILVSALSSQDLMTQDGITSATNFKVDFAQFRTGDINKNRLEFYYRIFNNDLQFVKIDGEYRANYEITLAIYDGRNNLADSYSREKSFSTKSYEKTISETDYRISQIDRLLSPGKYRIECTLRDKNGGGITRRNFKAALSKYDEDPLQLSGIEFVHAIDTGVTDSLFVKDNKTIIPSVGREYEGDSGRALIYYYEIYQGKDKRDSIKIETQILDSRHEVVYRDTLTSFFMDDNVIRQLRQISLGEFKGGMYELEIILKGRRDKIIDDLKEPFIIYWPPEAMIKNDFDAAVQQLKYIATQEEMEGFKKAETYKDKIKLWNDFWISRDPTSNTMENEFKRDYYHRIEYANLRFTVMKKEGWLTDRGMVFIIYGEPDQIEDYPFELDEKAYQIWYYYRAGDSRKFVFYDDWGDGDFRLQYPYNGLRR